VELLWSNFHTAWAIGLFKIGNRKYPKPLMQVLRCSNRRLWALPISWTLDSQTMETLGYSNKSLKLQKNRTMKQVLILLAISALMAPVCNPDHSREGSTSSGTSTPPGQHSNRAPINGGIAILIVGGIALGIYKLRAKRVEPLPTERVE